MILSILLLGLLVISFLCFAVSYAFLLPPSDFPKNIPTVPFYVTLLPLFFDIDQAELYRKYLEAPLQKHGAAKIFFAARWNILVQRPKFVAEVFRYEDVYAKSGNHKKIPYGVLAEYTGDNIISSHGENWRLYQSIIKPGLQRDCEVEPVLNNVGILIRLLLEEQAHSENKSVIVPQLVQRYTLANLSESLLGASFRVCQPLPQIRFLAAKHESIRFRHFKNTMRLCIPSNSPSNERFLSLFS
jgi:cytochrome P450